MRPDSPGPAVFGSMVFVPTALPRAKATRTNAIQPNVAVFQWLALQRPIRAARLLWGDLVDISISLLLESGVVFMAPTVGARRRGALGRRDDSRSHPATIRPPTQVGGGARAAALRSPHEPLLDPRAQARARRADRARGNRRRARGRVAGGVGAGTDHDAVVRRAGDRVSGPAAPRPPALSLRRAGGALAAGGGALVRRRAAGRHDRRRLPRGHGRRVPARQPARRRAGAARPGRRAQRRGDHRLQRPDPHAGRPPLHPAPVRDRLARRVRAARAGRAGRGGRGTRGAAPSGSARRPPASRSPRSARGSRASCTTSSPTPSASWCSRSARCGTSSPTRSTRTGMRSGASSRPAARRWRRCAASSARCAGTATTLELAPQPGLDSLDSLLEEVGRAGLPVRLHVDGERVPLPRAIDLSAYRIVQEGLTNALKHARASRRRRHAPLRARRAARSRSATTAAARRRATASATAWSASANASRSTAAR